MRAKWFTYIICMILLAGIFSACSNNLDIRQDYGFTVTHLPVPKKLKVGQSAEIRCQIERSGRYADTRYYLRYFQSSGSGSLSIDDGRVFLPNDSYALKNETFRLYYTSGSKEQAEIEVVVFDSFGKECLLVFSFGYTSEENVE